jgi:hypothetical protein
MEYIVINEIPYQRVQQYPQRRYYGDTRETKNNGGIICLLVILIIIIIIIICFVFATSGTNKNNFMNRFKKNTFQASPEAIKDYDTISNILKTDANPAFSKVKSAVGNIDVAKFNKIMEKKNTLQAEDFDRF